MSAGIQRLVIIGANGTALNVYSVAIALGYDVAMFVHDKKSGETLFGLPIIGSVSEIKFPKEYVFFVALGDNSLRKKYVDEILSIFPEATFPTLVHPSVILSNFCSVGEGTVVLPNCVIGPNAKIGAFCVVGALASIGHDSVLQNFSFVGPSSSLAGGTRLGLKSVIGIGAGTREGINIGDGSLVGAYCFLNNDLGAKKAFISVSRNVTKNRNDDDTYLS